MPTYRIPLRVVFYREDGDWMAHCLEFDLAGDGPTKEAALNCLLTAIQIQVEQSSQTGNLKNLFSPADGEYFRMFAAGKDVAIGTLGVQLDDSLDVEGTKYREYSEACGEELVPA